MRAFDRRSAILDHLQQHGRASTRRLSELFGVSQVTIRTDLVALAESGWLERRHGGAEVALRTVGEEPFDRRRGEHRAEKIAIASAAAALVRPGEHILLDSSTTAYQLALSLRERQGLCVITNNLQVAQVLAVNPGNEVVLLGGSLRGGTSSTVGLLAEEMLAGLHSSQGFFGAAGLTIERGLTDADSREVQIKRVMVAAVQRVNVLLDSSKFGQQAMLTFATLSQVHRILTDRGIPDEYGQALRKAGIDLQIVDWA